jgi:DNA-binding beta-propeller fold protein YncE
VRSRVLFPLLVLGLVSVAVKALEARSIRQLEGRSSERFVLLEPPLGGSHRPGAARAEVSLAGSTVAALPGGDALIIDADSGQLLRTDAAGAVRVRRDVAAGAPQLAVDRRRELAYVVDRAGDRIHVISLAGGDLRPLRQIATRAEPYGVALTPDGERLLVTAVADRLLTAYAAADGRELWSAALAPEPRGVAVSRDGRQVAVASLTSGALMLGRLDGGGAPRLERVALHQENLSAFEPVRSRGVPTRGDVHPDVSASANLADRPGESYARAAFAVAFIGDGIAVSPHQLSTPHQAEGSENAGSYGGGQSPPIAHRLAFVAQGSGAPRIATAQIADHQPRAIAYDEVRDRLYVFGYGSDTMTALGDAAQASVHLAYDRHMADQGECGPTGAAVADDGRVLVFCSLSRRLAVVSGSEASDLKVAWSAELAPSSLSASQLAGRALFRKGRDGRLSRGGGLACESCHPEARTDGLSWRIEARTLQTPLLAGRLVGTHPFKWDGGDRNLDRSLASTVRRLGGTGLSRADRRNLAAYLESVPRPRAPSVSDGDAVARGKAIFASAEVGCSGCHAGSSLTNRKKYPLAEDLPESDTPSLIGLATSAPYFHDGSAATLEALLTDRGSVHGMGGTAELGAGEVKDLISYLETL